MADRWTDEPRELLARQMLDDGWTCEGHEPDNDCTECARMHGLTVGRMLAALADAGLLVEPGGETREEWAVGLPGCRADHTWTSPTRKRDPQDEEITFRRKRFGEDQHGVVLTRTVHLGPWRDVPDA